MADQPPTPAPRPQPTPRPQPPPAPRPGVDCVKVQHTADILRAKGPDYAPLADFILAVTGCTKHVPPQ